MTEEKYLPISECKERYVYRLHSRNLAFGVFVPTIEGREDVNAFIGIRAKFGLRFLFAEYHHDNGPPYGTAKPLEDVGVIEEPRIRLTEDHPGLCRFCGERADFQEQTKWVHVSGDGSCPKIQPVRPKNRALYDFLYALEQEHGAQPPKEWRSISWRNK